jgi:hypothetical protein
MHPINYEFSLNHPSGPFTIQFSHIPESFEEVKPYAAQVMNCVREANLAANFGLSEETLELMGRDFEAFLINLYTSYRVRRSIDDRLGRSIRRLSDKLSNYASIAEGRIDG